MKVTNTLDRKNLRVGDKILVWATVKSVLLTSPQCTKNDVKLTLEQDIYNPSEVDVELATCKIEKHVSYKNIFDRLMDKVKSKIGLTIEETEMLEVLRKNNNI